MMSAMKFTHELTYDASPAEVYAMLSDPAFREEVCRAQQVVSAEVTLTPRDAGGFHLVVDQVQDTAGLPSIARRITGGAAGTREVVELDVKVKVPLVGGKLEALMADNIKSGLEVEQGVGTAWLAGAR